MRPQTHTPIAIYFIIIKEIVKDYFLYLKIFVICNIKLHKGSAKQKMIGIRATATKGEKENGR